MYWWRSLARLPVLHILIACTLFLMTAACGPEQEPPTPKVVEVTREVTRVVEKVVTVVVPVTVVVERVVTAAPILPPTNTPTLAPLPTALPSATLSPDQRKEIYLVYRVAYVVAEVAIKDSKPYSPENSSSFAADMVVQEYGVDLSSLNDILQEGDDAGWASFLSITAVTTIAFKADKEQRLPTLAEIKTVVGGSAAGQTVKDLADTMAESYPGGEFEKAGTALARRSSDFSRSEVEQVVDAYIKTIEEYYADPLGKAGYFTMAHERFKAILNGHEPTVREILEDRLITDEVSVAAMAAFLLNKGFYGNQSSIAKLRAAKERFPDAPIYRIFVENTISSLSE